MGRRLDTFPHRRLKAQNRYRLRIGDYRVIYTFDSEKNVVYLLAVGNRRGNLQACLTEPLSRPADSADLPLRLHDLQLEWRIRKNKRLPDSPDAR